MLNPLDALSTAAKINPQITKLAAGAVAVLSVVATAKGYFGDDLLTPLYGAVIVLCGMILLLVISNLKQIGRLESAFVWFVRSLLLAITALVFSSLSYVIFGVPPGMPCTVRFNTEACTRYMADPVGAQALVPGPPPAQSAAVGIRTGYTVYTQFAGFERGTVNAAGDLLKALGWKVPGAERLRVASGLNEIRYRGDADKDAADLLAADLRNTRLPKVNVRKVAIISEGTLELWVSQ